VKIYCDENIAPDLIIGLNYIQKPRNKKIASTIEFCSIKSEFGGGVADEDWIPRIAESDSCVITLDRNINRIKHQWALCQKNKLGMFFVKMPAKKGHKYMDLVLLLVKHLDKITEKAAKTKKPFAYEIQSRSFKKMKN